MSAPAPLQSLLDARSVWHAGRQARAGIESEPTGHAGLDDLLPCGGWPRGALTELLLPHDGIGELSLLSPMLAAISARGGRIVLVSPPHVPYAPAWGQSGVDLCALTVVDAGPRDAPWAMEQCLRSGSCAVVLGWPCGDAQSLRRLQLAAQSGACIGIVVRNDSHAGNPSPAALRMRCAGRSWQVLKCRGAAAPDRAYGLH